MREELVVVAYAGTIVYGYAVLKDVVVAHNRVAVDVAERSYDIIVSKFGFGVNEGHRAYLIHLCNLLFYYLRFTIYLRFDDFFEQVLKELLFIYGLAICSLRFVQ